MNKFLCGIALTLAASSLLAEEQDQLVPDVQAPAPPLIARVPDPSAWLVVIKPKGKGPPAPSSSPILPPKYLRQQYWIRSGDKMRCDNEWTDGTKTTDWVSGAVKYYQSPQGEGVKLFNPASFPTYHNFSTGDFERLDWLTLKDYVGVVKHEDKLCYLFQATHLAPKLKGQEGGRNLEEADFHAPTSPTTVLISVETHLPVLMKNDEGEFDYQFQTPPAGELQMPDLTTLMQQEPVRPTETTKRPRKARH